MDVDAVIRSIRRGKKVNAHELRRNEQSRCEYYLAVLSTVVLMWTALCTLPMRPVRFEKVRLEPDKVECDMRDWRNPHETCKTWRECRMEQCTEKGTPSLLYASREKNSTC